MNAKYSPPPPGVQPPSRWSTDEGLEELLGPGTRSIESETRTALQYYRSVDHAVSVFLTFFGPTIRTSETLDADTKRGLLDDLRDVFERYNRSEDGTAVIENRYRLTVATCA